mmetsp:Transcript_50578/g.100649  ORF Transcript_50578/g.100649 Transcript_50578/m.100649 type:complete len:97 (+) Transcript_50578:1524-1814(+)
MASGALRTSLLTSLLKVEIRRDSEEREEPMPTREVKERSRNMLLGTMDRRLRGWGGGVEDGRWAKERETTDPSRKSRLKFPARSAGGDEREEARAD